ncbi:hypothetical protein thsrh120_22980 [Rhizobium sp. No.120]
MTFHSEGAIMTKLSTGICIVVQNAVEGRTPHDRVQAERPLRPNKIETQVQAGAA